MQDIAEQHRVKGFIRRRKTRAVVATIVDGRFSVTAQVDAHCTRAEYRAEMMRDEAIATADVENFSAPRNKARNLQGHVIGAADFAAPALALEAAHNSVYNGR
jgi:hypothetical protein